jgi:hypothetical protein
MAPIRNNAKTTRFTPYEVVEIINKANGISTARDNGKWQYHDMPRSFAAAVDRASQLDPHAVLDYIPMGNRALCTWREDGMLHFQPKGLLHWVGRPHMRPLTKRALMQRPLYVCRGAVANTVEEVVLWTKWDNHHGNDPTLGLPSTPHNEAELQQWAEWRDDGSLWDRIQEWDEHLPRNEGLDTWTLGTAYDRVKYNEWTYRDFEDCIDQLIWDYRQEVLERDMRKIEEDLAKIDLGMESLREAIRDV